MPDLTVPSPPVKPERKPPSPAVSTDRVALHYALTGRSRPVPTQPGERLAPGRAPERLAGAPWQRVAVDASRVPTEVAGIKRYCTSSGPIMTSGRLS